MIGNLGSNLTKLQDRLKSEITLRDDLLQRLEQKENSLASTKKYNITAIKSREFIQRIAEETQRSLEFGISSIVSSALRAVFNDPYTFSAKFVKRRNKTECDLKFEKDGEQYKPIDASGGGPLDVASFSLRISFWYLNRTRPIMFLDEPGKFVSANLQSKVSAMIKMISDKLGIQFVIVTHQRNMIEAADKVFRIHNGKLISVETIMSDDGSKYPKEVYE